MLYVVRPCSHTLDLRRGRRIYAKRVLGVKHYVSIIIGGVYIYIYTYRHIAYTYQDLLHGDRSGCKELVNERFKGMGKTKRAIKMNAFQE